MEKTCFKCGSTKSIVVHHLSYNPEKTVFCCKSCHVKIHLNVRKLNLCPLSIKETNRLSHNSSNKRAIRYMKFIETIDTNITLQEHIFYNILTGNVGVGIYFYPNHGKRLLEVN
jgi:hypothetical protein